MAFLADSRPTVTRILFCCLGNICRSPTAEAVLREKLRRAGVARAVEVDSAGTGDYHVGEPPDRRAQRHALARGYDLSALRARQVAPADFERFDLILAMDADNLAALHAQCPPEQRGKVRLLTEFARRHTVAGVPDPYYGSPDGFDRVLDLVEDACDGLLEHLR